MLEQIEELAEMSDILYISLRNKCLPNDLQGKQYPKCFIIKDITECGKVKESFKITHDKLKEKINEYIIELEKASNLLIENERRFSQVQKIAHIGVWEWNLVTNEKYWSNEMYRIYGLDPQELAPPYNVFLSYVHPDDRNYVDNATKGALKGQPYDIDFRIVLTNGEEHIVHSRGEAIFDEKETPIQIIGAVMDITERKKAENALVKMEIARKKEIHHRIKNNLQVISSLLDLQAEKFNCKKNINCLEVMESFRESQNRVISMALIHEELHRDGEIDAINFSAYIKELADNLFLTYRLGNESTSLGLDIEESIFFDMDTSVPLGIIINELVSNSLKHAFTGRDKGEIKIKLHSKENRECKIEGDHGITFALSVSDNGVGIPKDLDIENLDSLGIQLVTSLVEQLEGELELNRNNGTHFTIRFTVPESNNLKSA